MASTTHGTGPPPFDLRALVREVAAESDAADPAIVAKDVARRISSDMSGEALEQALPLVVYHLARHPAPTSTPHLDQDHGDNQSPPVGVRPARSSKVAAIRETWRRHLRDRVSVGPQDWKFLGDCTADDLAYAAAVRDDLARANAARADWLRRLADLVGSAGVDRVDEVPAEQLAEHFGGAA